MPTRLTNANLRRDRSTLARQLRRVIFTGATAGLVFGFPGELSADGKLQLRPPLNSSLTMRPAETNWTKRPSSDSETAAPDSTGRDGNGEPKVGDQPQQKTLPSIQAIPTSGPLDRFRRPLPKRPSTMLGIPVSESAGGVAAVPTPGDEELDRLPTPALPPNGTWRGRTIGQKTRNDDTAAATPDNATPDGFRQPIVDGNWVARDAINRVQPLTDPGQKPPPATQPEPSSKRQVDVVNTPAATTKKETTAIANDQNGTPRPLSEPNVQITPKNEPSEAAAKNSGSTTNSMSLQEAKRAVEVVEPKASVELDAVAEPKVSAEPNASVNPKASAELKTSVELDAADRPVGPATDNSADRSNQWTDDVLESLTEPKSTEIPKTKEAQPQRKSDTKPAKTTTSEITREPAKALPKRKPLASIVDAKLSSASRASQSPPKQTVKVKEDVSASVGDIVPYEKQFLDYTGRPAAEIRPTRTVASMRRGIERTLRYFYDHPEVADGRSNWGMMHSLMVYGSDTKVIVGRKKYSAIAWIAGNNNCRGQRLLTHDAEGIQAKSGVGLQGHQGQFLAVLGMCNVPTNYPLHAGKMKYSVAGLIEAEQKACKAGEELTFTLIGLSHYLDTDSTWIADDGTEWDFERLIAEELKQPIIGAACGGTHRLMGYTHALRKRRAEGKPITGHWKRAETYTKDFINYAYSLQNRDGSMSTKWFEGRADNGEVDRKIQTTGHVVEWLLTVTPDEQLQDRRLVAAVSFLLRSVGSDLSHEWSIGPKGHALRSLSMYHQRVFRAGLPWIPSSIARSPRSTR